MEKDMSLKSTLTVTRLREGIGGNMLQCFLGTTPGQSLSGHVISTRQHSRQSGGDGRCPPPTSSHIQLWRTGLAPSTKRRQLLVSQRRFVGVFSLQSSPLRGRHYFVSPLVRQEAEVQRG